MFLEGDILKIVELSMSAAKHRDSRVYTKLTKTKSLSKEAQEGIFY